MTKLGHQTRISNESLTFLRVLKAKKGFKTIDGTILYLKKFYLTQVKKNLIERKEREQKTEDID